ncbi:MAG TPA: hypothetical protein VLA91_05375 [Acidimicrobiia bacterium]|nr:hypothetical protein [Acidimicrobiia bacterium]
MRRRLAMAATLALLATACAGERHEMTTTTLDQGQGASFELIVEPTEFFPVTPGQLFVVLVSSIGGEAPIVVSASVSGAANVEPQKLALEPGDVAELTVVAMPESVGGSITVDLTAQSGSVERTHSLNLEVVDWPDDIGPLATELRDRFVNHLEQEYPELGISTDTEWTPTITKPQILVVMHYLFFSEEWEMGVIWHVTVPEHAWSRMYLRPRDQLTPTFGLEIPTYLDPASQPSPWTPPPEIDR